MSAFPDIPGKAAAIFQVIADAHSNIDMIVQNVSTHGTGRTDISFTLPIVEGADALAALHAAQGQIGFESIEYNEQIGKLSLIGAGMRSHPGVSATFFKALSDAGININMISTSEIRISVVTHADLSTTRSGPIHRAFDLDSEAKPPSTAAQAAKESETAGSRSGRPPGKTRRAAAFRGAGSCFHTPGTSGFALAGLRSDGSFGIRFDFKLRKIFFRGVLEVVMQVNHRR